MMLMTGIGRMYYGATLMAKGHNDRAATIFEKLILDRPDYEPDPESSIAARGCLGASASAWRK